MNRFALSLSLMLVMAPLAQAEGTRSLGVTVAPVGGFVVSNAARPLPLNGRGLAAGYSATLSWSFSKEDSRGSVGGHIASSALFTEATPISVRYTPFPNAPVHPFIGVGLSLMVPHPAAALDDGSSPLRLGGEVSGGVGFTLSKRIFLSAEGRYQNFSFTSDPTASRRIELTSAHLGVGFNL
jgi:hypothetical protein